MLSNPVFLALVCLVAGGVITYWVTWLFSRKGPSKEDYAAMRQDLLAIDRRHEREFQQYLDGLPHAPAAVKGPFERGQEAQKHRRWDEAIAIYDSALVEVLSNQQSQKVALYSLIGICHHRAGRMEQALSSITQSMALAKKISDRPGWAVALYNKGLVLAQQGKRVEASKTYDELWSRFGKDTLPVIRAMLASSLNNKGLFLEEQGKPEVAIRNYDEVVRRFGKDTLPVIRRSVATALRNKGVALDHQGKHEEVVRAFDDMNSRFGDATEPGIRAQVATALSNKGALLGQQGKSDEAISTLQALIARFGKDTEPEVKTTVESAKSMLAK